MRMTFEEAKMILENYIYDITRVGEENEAIQSIIEYAEKAYMAGYEAGTEDVRKNIQYLRNCSVKKSDVIIDDVEVVLDNLRNAKALEREKKINCDTTDCNNCVNHKYCDYEYKTVVAENTTTEQFGNSDKLDCISRANAMTEMQMNARRYSLAKEYGGMGQVEWSDFLISIKDALNILRDLPSAQPKAGHWIYDKSIENWKCSECGETPKTLGYVGDADFMREHFKYCNHCGAKMSEVEQ